MAWKRGQSGNPKGRTPGRLPITQMRESIAQSVPDILAALKEQALAGDVGAARLLLERALPPIKATEQAVPLVLDGATLSDRGRSVLDAIAEGQIAPAQGAQLVAAIGQLARVVEIDELTARIDALEKRNGRKP